MIMKQKIVILMIILNMMALTLIGCGDKQNPVQIDEASAAPAVPAADFYEGQTNDDDDIMAAADIEDFPEEDEILKPELDEVIEDVFNYAESEGMEAVIDEDIIKELIEANYNDETLDDMVYYGEGYSYFIYDVLKSLAVFSPVPIAPEGIIVLSYTVPTYSSSYSWKSTGTFKCQTFTINLDCINPDTGEVQHLRTFSSEDTHSCSLAKNGLGYNTVLSRMHFNSDLTQLTATLTLEDGSVHVGWIDESGEFTDVSAKIASDAGDFSAMTNHTNPCFGLGGYFYFRDATNSDVQAKRVPLDNLTASAVEIVAYNVNNCVVDRILEPLPDGTMGNSTWYYYDESMEYPAKGRYFGDWISPFECVGIDGDMIYKYTLSGGDHNYFGDDWYSDKAELIPDIEGRRNMNPVVSPDRTKVAFLSALTTGTDESPYLYIVPVEGGNPVKISTDYIFAGYGIDIGYNKKVGDEYYWNTTILLTWE